MSILNLYCNRFGWERSVVDSADSQRTLRKWSKQRYMALKRGHDYRTAIALIPWGKK